MNYFKNKQDAVAYVADQLTYLKPDLPWTMIITRGKYEVFCVRTVTASSSDDTDLQRAKFFSETQVNI